MKKVLIWNCHQLANTGGPEGYLYNIHEYLRQYPNNQIFFLSDLINVMSLAQKNATKKNNWFKHIVFDIKQIINLVWRNYRQRGPVLPISIDLNNYDYIHIHKITDFFSFKKYHSDYRGKIILTSHCPCPWADEMVAPNDGFVKLFRRFALKKECQAFKKADFLMFPCSEAKEPYEREPLIKRIFDSNTSKFFYVPSSILDLSIDENKMQKFSELGIPEDSFVISYFGRHNYIKGYDILTRVGETLLDKYPNLYFLCAGKGDIAPYRHPRWKELGFIHNTHELLWQSDLYISANRETYFDLVVLEILRSKTRLILSSTGGNKFFKGLSPNDIYGLEFFDIDCFDKLVNIIESSIKIKKTKPSEYLKYGIANRNLFLKYFTVQSYVDRYILAINELK